MWSESGETLLFLRAQALPLPVVLKTDSCRHQHILVLLRSTHWPLSLPLWQLLPWPGPWPLTLVLLVRGGVRMLVVQLVLNLVVPVVL